MAPLIQTVTELKSHALLACVLLMQSEHPHTINALLFCWHAGSLCFALFFIKKKNPQHISQMREKERNDMSVHPGMQAASRAADCSVCRGLWL